MKEDMSEELRKSLQEIVDGNYRTVTYDKDGNRTEKENKKK